MYDPPAYLWAITIAGPVAVAAVTCVVLYRGAERTGLARGRAALLAAAAAILFGGWLTASAVIAGHGWYRTLPWFPAAVTGYLALLLALGRIPVVARALTAPGMLSRLELPHAPRVVGVVFLFYLALGHLPALFALPAGLGDIAAGIAAPFVARRLARGAGRRPALWFTVFGLTDLAVALTLGALTGFPLLHVTPSSAPITELPLALIPVATVPLFVALHIASLSVLAKAARAARPATSSLINAAALKRRRADRGGMGRRWPARRAPQVQLATARALTPTPHRKETPWPRKSRPKPDDAPRTEPSRPRARSRNWDSRLSSTPSGGPSSGAARSAARNAAQPSRPPEPVVNPILPVGVQHAKGKVGGYMGPGTWVRNILAGAAILGLACSAAAIGAGPADAGPVPVVYSAHADGWHGYVRPAAIYFGQGGAPFLAKLHWSSWTGTSARATGKLWAQKPGCSLPSYKCPYSSRWAGVYLTTIRWHHGTRYFARMAVRFWYGGKWRWDVGWLQNGYWAFPLVYPYL